MRVLVVVLFASAVILCTANNELKSINAAGETIQKLLNERIGKKIVEAAKEVKGILSQSLGKHVKTATAKLIVDNAVEKMTQQVTPTQNDGVAKVGTDQSLDDCVKECKQKKLAKGKGGKPNIIHHIKSMHKGAPSHKTPHNKGPRHRKNMPGPMVPPPPQQQGLDQQQPPQQPNLAAPTMPQQQTPPACQPPCPAACAPACTQDCCRPMLSIMQLPPAAAHYYPSAAPMCPPPCTAPSCAPTCPSSCCAPPPPPPPPPTCPPVCVSHCYMICPRGCCRMDIPHKKQTIMHKKKHREQDEEIENEEKESSSIISERKSGSAERNPMERNKIPRKKISTYNAAV